MTTIASPTISHRKPAADAESGPELARFACLSTSDLLGSLNTSATGLSDAEAQERLSRDTDSVRENLAAETQVDLTAIHAPPFGEQT